jgi:pimeloyl-ACP methyl ester carboxylesterase
MKTRFKTVGVDGLNVFHCEAGDPGRPSISLLHGFPAASHMFRDLVPELAPNIMFWRRACPASA